MSIKILHVPSCGITAVDQLTPTDTLLRCEAGLQLWRKGGFDLIFCTGGMFLPPSVQTRAASVIMKEWFVEHGVPADKVLVEMLSRDTFENVSAQLSVLRMQKIEDFEMTVCTQWAHAIRFYLTYSLGYGIRVDLYPLSYPMSRYSWFAEFVSFFLHLFTPRGRNPISRREREKRSRAAQGA